MNTKVLTIGKEKAESLPPSKPFLGWFSFEGHSSRALWCILRNSWKTTLKSKLSVYKDLLTLDCHPTPNYRAAALEYRILTVATSATKFKE